MTMQKVLESLAKGQIRTERLTKEKQVVAPVTRGPGAPSHKTPVEITLDRGAPQMEGGTDVGGRRRRVRDPTLTLKSRPPDTQGGALEVSGSDSGESGRGREDRLKGKKEGGGQHSCTRSGPEGKSTWTLGGIKGTVAIGPLGHLTVMQI